MNLGILKEIIDRKNISADTICKITNITKAGYYKIFQRNSTNTDTVSMLANAINCDAKLILIDKNTGQMYGELDDLAQFSPSIVESQQETILRLTKTNEMLTELLKSKMG